jgi:hypothetical protein
MKEPLIAIVLGAALLMGCSGSTKEAAQPTALATSAPPTTVPIEDTAVPVVSTAVPIAPKATPDSVLYQACALSYGDLTTDTAWVKCLCNYINNHYTMAQFSAGKSFTPQEAADIASVCGQPSDLKQ